MTRPDNRSMRRRLRLAALLSIAFTASASGAQNAAVVTNLPVNGSFESSSLNWNAGVVRDNTYAHSGTASGKVDSAAHGTYFDAHTTAAISGATAGRTYTASVYVYLSEPGTLNFALRETGGATPSAQSLSTWTLPAGWTPISQTRTISQNDRTGLEVIVVAPKFNGAPYQGPYWIDDANLTTVDQNPPTSTNPAGAPTGTSNGSVAFNPPTSTNPAGAPTGTSNGSVAFDADPNATSSVLPWEYFNPGSGNIVAAATPNGASSGGIVRVTEDPLDEQGKVYQETVTPTAHASDSPGSDSVYLWNNDRPDFGHSGQENWEHFRVMFPAGAYRATPGEWNWLGEHHNDPGYKAFVSAGRITSEFPELCWGVETKRQLANGTVGPQIFMRIWAGQDNTSENPKQSPPLYVYTKVPLLANHWYDFLVRVVWSPDPNVGVVEWWLDGNLVFSQHHATLWQRPDGSVDVVNFELNNYRVHANWDSTVFYSRTKLGATRTSVGF